jgi:hypothetical protein
MSSISSSITGEHNTQDHNAMAEYLPLGEDPSYATSYVSSMFASVEQIENTINVEYQHERHELIRLNESLSLFINKVQQLELQNAKYVAKLADFRRQSHISVLNVEWNERHIHLQTDLESVSYEKFDYEFEFQLFQMQTEIYKQLIHIVDRSSNEQHLKLQHELDESSSSLVIIRTSYTELQNKLTGLRAEREDKFQQYLKVANSWSHSKKQISVLNVNVQALKNQYAFYKGIRSNVAR